MKVPQVRLHGETYIFIGDPGIDGAIAKPEEYAHGRPSYAHLYEDGRVRRFGEVIATTEDLEWLGMVDAPDLEDDSFDNLFGPWPGEPECGGFPSPFRHE